MDSSQEQGRDRSRPKTFRRHDERCDGLGEDRQPPTPPEVRSEGQEGAARFVTQEDREPEPREGQADPRQETRENRQPTQGLPSQTVETDR